MYHVSYPLENDFIWSKTLSYPSLYIWYLGNLPLLSYTIWTFSTIINGSVPLLNITTNSITVLLLGHLDCCQVQAHPGINIFVYISFIRSFWLFSQVFWWVECIKYLLQNLLSKSAILFVPQQSAKCTPFLVIMKVTEKKQNLNSYSAQDSAILVWPLRRHRSVNIRKTKRRGQGPCSERLEEVQV